MQHADARHSKADWPVPAALIALSLVPVLAGGARLAHLMMGPPITPEDVRFVAAPGPVIVHIMAVTLYCLLGAFQFAPGWRRRHPRWHRMAGRILVPCGLLAALTGLWMTQFYLRIATDSAALYGMRLAVGAAMVTAIVLAVDAVRKRNYRSHGAWMIRAYALGQGAGSQVFTHLPWFILVGAPGPTSRAWLMAAGWAINIVFAEWIIARKFLSRPRSTPPERIPAPDLRR